MSDDDAKVEFSTGETTPEVSKSDYPIVFVSDFGAGDRLGKLTATDKDEFADMLSNAKPTVAVALPDPLSGGDDWEFQLTFDSMKSFEPDALLKQCPNAGWRVGMREKIIQRRGGQITGGEYESAVNAAVGADGSLGWLRDVGGAAPAAPAAVVPPPEGGSILDMVDAPDEGARVSADVERLAKAAGDAGAQVSGTEGARLDKHLARLDGELGKIADAILRLPAVRGLETAWRSLKFFIDRVEFRDTGLKLFVIDAPRDEAVARVVEGVVTPAFDGEIPTPGMIVFDYAFSNTPVDLATLDELAQQAASLPVPVVFPFEASFFNIKGWRLLKNLPNLGGMTDNYQYAKWRSLREQPYAKSLAPVIGRFILRAPYTAKPRSATYSHNETAGKISDLVWAHGHVAMAICAARSFAKHGWPTRMFGAEAGKIEDLSVVENPNDKASPWGPGDLFLPDRRVDEPPEFGLNILTAVKNQDYCQLLGGVSAARPIQTKETNKHQAALEISLPYQQFANVASTYLSEQLPELRGLAPDKIQEKLIFGLANLMGIKSAYELEAVQVGVGSNPEDPSQTLVQLRLEPPPRVVPGGLSIEFSFAL